MSIQPGHKEADQADELRILFQPTEGQNESLPDDYPVRERDEIDVLNLPPRKEVHGQNKRFKFKITKPSIRLTSIVIFVLLLLGLALYIWQQDLSTLILRL